MKNLNRLLLSASSLLLVSVMSTYGGFWMGQRIMVGECHFETHNPNPQSRSILARSSKLSEQKQDGWHSIDIFYGNPDRYLPQGDKKWFSQVRQDQIVSSLLKGKTEGYFLDLAANDAIKRSNTLALEKTFNWSGLCVEPNPEYWYKLAHRKCAVAGAVVGRDRMEEVYFNFKGAAKGGIVGNKFDNANRTRTLAASDPRYTIPLLELLERYFVPKDFDYFSLDVEGAEAYILDIVPFDQYKFKVMTAERLQKSTMALLVRHGYEFLGEIGGFGEQIWVRTDIKHELDMASLEVYNVKQTLSSRKRRGVG